MAEKSGAIGGHPSNRIFTSFLLLFLLVSAAFYFTIRAKNNAMFVYALDDPYIHLALSEQIAHGHYGINPQEYSSPSSSVLWPFLLAPFAGTTMHPYVPLILNILFGLGSVMLLTWASLKWQPAEKWQLRALTLALLISIANLVSLTFLGMEHVLQVFLAIACAVGLGSVWEGEPIPLWCLVSAAVGPLVRYENLAISAAVCLVLSFTGESRKAMVLLLCSCLPLVLFGLFLRHLGLPMLPTSMLVKGSVQIGSSHVLASSRSVLFDTFKNSHQRERWPLVIAGAMALGGAALERIRIRRILLAAAALVALLHIVIGRFGWFFRYEVYALIFVTLLLYRSGMWPMTGWRKLVTLGVFSVPYLIALSRTIPASEDIYRQQFQMHRFVAEFYRNDVAVNDLGLVSYRRPPGVRILDIFGLGSVEAAKATKTAAWLDEIVSRHGVELAMIYPQWFEVPKDWVRIGSMCEVGRAPVFNPGNCVVFFSTHAQSTAGIRQDLLSFVPTLPPGVTFVFDPPR